MKVIPKPRSRSCRRSTRGAEPVGTTQPRTKRANSLGEIFTTPLLLAGSIGVGLLCTLFGDGIWNVISWAAMSVPLAVVACHVLKARKKSA
jgi:hypothetical protein